MAREEGTRAQDVPGPPSISPLPARTVGLHAVGCGYFPPLGDSGPLAAPAPPPAVEDELLWCFFLPLWVVVVPEPPLPLVLEPVLP